MSSAPHDEPHEPHASGSDDEPASLGGDDELSDAELEAILESLLLIVDSPAGVDLLSSVTGASVKRITETLNRMSAELTARSSGMDLRYAGDGWRLYTRTVYAPYVERLLLDGARSKLTRAALETLAVVAYRQRGWCGAHASRSWIDRRSRGRSRYQRHAVFDDGALPGTARLGLSGRSARPGPVAAGRGPDRRHQRQSGI